VAKNNKILEDRKNRTPAILLIQLLQKLFPEQHQNYSRQPANTAQSLKVQ
jgi:hypothetical protein